MSKSKGSIRVLIFVGLAIVAVFVIGIPIIVSVFILPNIKQETVGEFPKTFEEQKEYVDQSSEPWV